MLPVGGGDYDGIRPVRGQELSIHDGIDVEQSCDPAASDHNVVERVRAEMQLAVPVGHRGAQHHPAFDTHVTVEVRRKSLGCVFDTQLAHEAHPAHVDAHYRDRVSRDGVDGSEDRPVSASDDD